MSSASTLIRAKEDPSKKSKVIDLDEEDEDDYPNYDDDRLIQLDVHDDMPIFYNDTKKGKEFFELPAFKSLSLIEKSLYRAWGILKRKNYEGCLYMPISSIRSAVNNLLTELEDLNDKSNQELIRVLKTHIENWDNHYTWYKDQTAPTLMYYMRVSNQLKRFLEDPELYAMGAKTIENANKRLLEATAFIEEKKAFRQTYLDELPKSEPVSEPVIEIIKPKKTIIDSMDMIDNMEDLREYISDHLELFKNINNLDSFLKKIKIPVDNIKNKIIKDDRPKTPKIRALNILILRNIDKTLSELFDYVNKIKIIRNKEAGKDEESSKIASSFIEEEDIKKEKNRKKNEKAKLAKQRKKEAVKTSTTSDVVIEESVVKPVQEKNEYVSQIQSYVDSKAKKPLRDLIHLAYTFELNKQKIPSKFIGVYKEYMEEFDRIYRESKAEVYFRGYDLNAILPKDKQAGFEFEKIIFTHEVQYFQGGISYSVYKTKGKMMTNTNKILQNRPPITYRGKTYNLEDATITDISTDTDELEIKYYYDLNLVKEDVFMPIDKFTENLYFRLYFCLKEEVIEGVSSQRIVLYNIWCKRNDASGKPIGWINKKYNKNMKFIIEHSRGTIFYDYTADLTRNWGLYSGDLKLIDSGEIGNIGQKLYICTRSCIKYNIIDKELFGYEKTCVLLPPNVYEECYIKK